MMMMILVVDSLIHNISNKLLFNINSIITFYLDSSNSIWRAHSSQPICRWTVIKTQCSLMADTKISTFNKTLKVILCVMDHISFDKDLKKWVL